MNTCIGLLLAQLCYKFKIVSDRLNNSGEKPEQQNLENNNTIYESILSSSLSESSNEKHEAYIHAPLRSLDVIIPKKTGILDGDWFLKNSDSCSYPWRKTKNYLNFELVPWRKPKPDFEPSNTPPIPDPMPIKWNIDEENKILAKLSKKRNKNQIKKQSKEKMSFKNNVKVRLIFALELKNKKHKPTYATIPKIKPRIFEKAPLLPLLEETTMKNKSQFDKIWQQKPNDAVYIAIKELEVKSNHWGYFSQRNININEIIDKFTVQKSYHLTHENVNKLQINNTSDTYSGRLNEYKRLSLNKDVNKYKKAFVTYCFVDNGKYAMHFCSKCKR